MKCYAHKWLYKLLYIIKKGIDMKEFVLKCSVEGKESDYVNVVYARGPRKSLWILFLVQMTLLPQCQVHSRTLHRRCVNLPTLTYLYVPPRLKKRDIAHSANFLSKLCTKFILWKTLKNYRKLKKLMNCTEIYKHYTIFIAICRIFKHLRFFESLNFFSFFKSF